MSFTLFKSYVYILLQEIHQRTIIAPDDPSFGHSFGEFPGKLTHYSSRSQKIVDKDEVKEVSELKDGEISTETTRTHHHEEAYDDEVPVSNSYLYRYYCKMKIDWLSVLPISVKFNITAATRR